MAKLVPIPRPLDGGEPLLVVHDGVPYCVMAINGEVLAFVAACSHKDRALVPLRLKKGEIACPHHGATFDPTTGDVARERGNDVPTGLRPVEVVTGDDGTLSLRARKRHRKLLSKKERRRMRKIEHAGEVNVRGEGSS